MKITRDQKGRLCLDGEGKDILFPGEGGYFITASEEVLVSNFNYREAGEDFYQKHIKIQKNNLKR